MKNLFLLSIGINTDIFETNIINIALLLVLLFNVVGAALKTSMLERKTQILTEVEGSEQSLTEAVERLSQA
jgi:F0F1-type ATP synthase membrane subunit b/b'